jgi:hypothetical protein
MEVKLVGTGDRTRAIGLRVLAGGITTASLAQLMRSGFTRREAA